MPLAPRRPRHFASDNFAGICPEAWNALEEANRDHAVSYGDDPWTAQAVRLIQELFETDCEVFFVFNGTAANALAISSLCLPHHSVVCHELAHLDRDECSAPAFFSHGVRLLPVPGPEGKVTSEGVIQAVSRTHGVHSPKPTALSITQATECGTVYSLAQLGDLRHITKKWALHLHMDGARLANAATTLGTPPRAFTWEVGVDVLSLGATKNGSGIGEAVVFFNRDLAREFGFRRKQAGQLASKMRFLAAPWVGLLRDGAWLRHAAHSNRMAALLAESLVTLPACRLLFPTEANAVFVDLPLPVICGLHRLGWHFYPVIGETGCRLMCAWDTTESDIQAFVADLKTVQASRQRP